VKFLLDENVTVAALEPLRVIFVNHEFSTTNERKWSGLNPDAPIHGYYATLCRHAGSSGVAQQTSSLPSRHPPTHRTPTASLATPAIGASGLKDLPLFDKMSNDDFNGLITRDAGQLTNPHERQTLRSCGLHWIGLTTPTFRGTMGIALETAGLLAGLPFVLNDLDMCLAPTAFHIRAVPHQHNQRVKAETL